MVDAAIVKSEEMRATIPRSTAFVIPNGVDMELFRPIDRAAARRQLGLAPNRPYVAFVGDPARPEKDFALARAALERVTERLPEAELLVVHGQPVECVVLALNAADALVLTSYFEGSPNAVKEAMACNLPVVSVDVGDVRRVIGGTPGCHVCRRAADDLGDRLAEVLSVRERTAGRAAIAHLSQSAIARQVERVYDYVLVRRASGEVSPP
jgi:glycosyltransferase involved in cell wall biosynthesis